MAYIESHKFRRCVSCGRWMRRNKQDKRLCVECSNASEIEEKDTLKTIKCIDCGESVYVSMLNTKTCRCEKCQEEADKQAKRDWWARNNSSID